ncbi:MAG: hypothetical protein ABI792_01180 [bacterium]
MKSLTQEERKLLKPIFWDTDINKLDILKYKKYTIERILQNGRMEHINWMLQTFADDEVINAVKNSLIIDRRTANYWALYYKINKDEIVCFSKFSIPSNSVF